MPSDATEQRWTMRETPDAKRTDSPTNASEIHEGQDVTVDVEPTKKLRLTLTVLSTFKIVHLFNIMKIPWRKMSMAELMRSMTILPEASLAMNCMLSPLRCNSHFLEFLHLFRIRCFCTRYTSETCLSCSSHIGSSAGLNFPK